MVSLPSSAAAAATAEGGPPQPHLYEKSTLSLAVPAFAPHGSGGCDRLLVSMTFFFSRWFAVPAFAWVFTVPCPPLYRFFRKTNEYSSIVIIIIIITSSRAAIRVIASRPSAAVSTRRNMRIN